MCIVIHTVMISDKLYSFLWLLINEYYRMLDYKAYPNAGPILFLMSELFISYHHILYMAFNSDQLILSFNF